MVKFSRYILILIGIVVISFSIPKLYWTIFEKVPVSPSVFYSCTLNDFIIVGSGKAGQGEKIDGNGKIYTNAEYEKNMPLMFFRQLMVDGSMPDSINGVKLEPMVINKSNSFYRYTPKKIFSPVPTLYPLFEAESGKVNLAMPEDFFRIAGRMEFIAAKTNKIDEAKSELFTKALKDEGFIFPAGIIAGLPTTRKSKDEGYFVTDNENKLFHIKMIKGQPFVASIKTPEDLDIVFIECVDLRNSEFYCYVFTRSKGIYVVMDEVYDLQRFPVENFDPLRHSARFSCDLFNKCITAGGDNWIKCTAIDDMYEIVDTYEESWPGKYERTEGKVFASLFPFEISLKSEDSSFIGFNFLMSPGLIWIIINIVLTALAAFLIVRKNGSMKGSIVDLAITAVTGIYGFLAILIFPNKFSN